MCGVRGRIVMNSGAACRVARFIDDRIVIVVGKTNGIWPNCGRRFQPVFRWGRCSICLRLMMTCRQASHKKSAIAWAKRSHLYNSFSMKMVRSRQIVISCSTQGQLFDKLMIVRIHCRARIYLTGTSFHLTNHPRRAHLVASPNAVSSMVAGKSIRN